MLITQFNLSVEKARWILNRIEYNALIMRDKEEMTFEDYEQILKEEYNFNLDLSRLYQKEANTKTAIMKQVTNHNAMCYTLTMVAYILLDKIGLNKNRTETIIKRTLFYVNCVCKNDIEIEKYKAELKQKYNCEINITGR